MQGKVSIVTGAGSRGDGIGNGRATAIMLAREGSQVVLLDNNADWLLATEDILRGEGGDFLSVVTDVANEQSCAEAVEKAASRYGHIDVLVNNVGITGPGGNAIDVDLASWDRALRINVTSMMLMSKYVLKFMVKQRSGSIVNIASVAGLVGGHPSLLYPTSKGAVINMSRAMATHHGAVGVRVNCVAPGMLYTPMVASRGMSEQQREERKLRSLLGTEGTGWDVANAVLFLASDEARWITGVVLPVDAGATASLGRLPVPSSIGGLDNEGI